MITASIQEESAIISAMAVDVPNQGHGRTEYETWERQLPLTVKWIGLRTVSTSKGFWEKMGFNSVAPTDPLLMIKFVNTHIGKQVNSSC